MKPDHEEVRVQKTVKARCMRVKDAAVYLGVSTDSVRILIQCGELKYMPIGNVWLVDVLDLDALIERRKERKASEQTT